MTLLLIILGFILAYLVGSIPTAVMVGKAQMGIDIRDYGSGNSGATNTFRVLGKKAGILVMTVDVFKGFAATCIPKLLLLIELNHPISIDVTILQIFFGIAAVVGHIFPIYVNFKGGKGVATLLGMIIAINPLASLTCVIIFLIVLFTSKYVSLGSMIAALAFPILLLIPKFNSQYQDSPQILNILIAFGFVLFSLVVLTHQKNIKRLINGEESKAKISLKKKQD